MTSNMTSWSCSILIYISLFTLALSQSTLTSVPLTIWTDRSSTFAIEDASTTYNLVDPNVVINIVSGNNRQNSLAVINGSADVGIITGSLQDIYAKTYPALYTLPVFAAAVVPIYRIDAIGTAVPLILSREALARIYMGNITWWNDSAITSTNPTLTMPKQQITIIIDADPGEVHTVYTTAFSKFATNFSNVIPITYDPTNYWPLDRYAKYRWFQGLFGASTGVYNTDGSIGMTYQSIAIATQNNIASLINKAGATVRPSATSVTFAATELGTTLTLVSTAAADLTDCGAASGWPIATFSYLLVNVETAFGTCKSRAALVQFFLNFYQSSTMSSLLGIREIAPIPDIVMKQLDIINIFGTLIKCRGQAALTYAVSDKRIMAIPSSLKFLSNLLVSMYPTNSAQWSLDVNPDDVNVQRLVQNEVDLVFFDPAAVDPPILAALQADPDYYLLPTLGFSFTWTYNPTIAYGVTLSKPLVLDEYIVSLIYYSCILNWDDPRIVALNPWIVNDLHLLTNVPIIQILACYSAVNPAPAANYLLEVADHLMAQNKNNASDELTQCVNNYNLWDEYYDCEDVPAVHLQYVVDETVTSVLVTGTWTSMGVMVAVNDPVYTMPQLQVTGEDGLKHITKPNPDGMKACASDTFNKDTLSFDFRSSTNVSCYPWTQQVWVAFRKSYTANSTSSQSCVRGKDALNYLAWLYTDELTNGITESQNFIRLTQDPAVLSAYTTLLNGVLCDGETMLITLPVEWSLTSGFAVFGVVAAILGIIMTIALGAFVVVYHKHPIIRASSPIFMLFSLVGVILMFIGAVAIISPVSDSSCNAVSWLINIGLMVTFAPLFAKVWRIYRIFGTRKLSVKKITNRYLFGIICVLLALEAILLIVWQIISPLQPYTAVTLEGTPQREHLYSQCGVDGAGSTIFAIVGVEKGLLLVFGALMAFTTRRVTSSFNESGQVSLAIYNCVFSVGIIAPVILVIDATGDILIALLLFVLLWIAFFTALILVVPKALHILSGDANTNDNKSVVSSSSGFSFLSLAALVTPAMGKSYLASLKRHVEAVEAHIATQQKGGRQRDEFTGRKDFAATVRPSASMRQSTGSSTKG